MTLHCSQYNFLFLLFIFLLNGHVKLVQTSVGDRSWVYQRCLKVHIKINCSESNEELFLFGQPWYSRLTQWTCMDEVKYNCMWMTVDAFIRDKTPVPQFYGKWPFKRYLGMQEPASVIFSLFNGICHLRIWSLHCAVSSSTPMYYIWHIYALVGLNAWTWSMVFHTRDTDFTEMMDYFGAFSIVVFTTFTFLCRTLGTEPPKKVALFAGALTCLYLQHIYYLKFIKFDYGYNMIVNLTVGSANSVAWLTWCYRHRHLHHTRKCAIVFISLNLLILLEILEFPPYFWIFDAHSLWHAGTIPVSYLWYSFILEDCIYLSKQEVKKGT